MSVFSWAQDVVRLTFKAFHDALRAQGDAIRWLESALEGKADSEDVWLALQEKASNTALNSKSRELVNALTHKADKEETHGCVTSDDLHSQLRHKADRADTDASIAELRNWASSARERLASLEESVHSLSESKESIRSTVAHIDSSMHSMHDTIKNAEASVEAIKGDLSGLHDSKRELGNAINTERQSRQSHTNELSEACTPPPLCSLFHIIHIGFCFVPFIFCNIQPWNHGDAGDRVNPELGTRELEGDRRTSTSTAES